MRFQRPLPLLIGLLAMSLAGCGPSDSAPPATRSSPPPPPAAATADPAGTAAGSPADDAAWIARGRAVVSQAFSVLSSNLLAALTQQGPSNALEFCSVNVGPLTASVTEAQGLRLRRVSHRPRNPENRASTAELEWIAGYQAGLATGQTNPPVIVHHPSGAVTFVAPILLGNPLCLQCHGRPGTEIAPGTLAAIDRLYPGDQARGFRLNELRGLWVVDFPASPAVVAGQSEP